MLQRAIHSDGGEVTTTLRAAVVPGVHAAAGERGSTGRAGSNSATNSADVTHAKVRPRKKVPTVLAASGQGRPRPGQASKHNVKSTAQVLGEVGLVPECSKAGSKAPAARARGWQSRARRGAC